MSHYDPTDLQQLEQVQAETETRKKLQQDTEAGDIKWLMGSKRGRRIMWRLLDQAGVFRLSFATNALSMAFAEGGRNGGLKLMALTNAHCPDQYTQMLKEANEYRNPDDGGN